MSKRSIVLLLAFAIVALGFLRDYIFVSINHQIEPDKEGGGDLFILKWVLTVIFCVIYFANTSLILFFVFRSRKYLLLVLFVYLILLVVSFFVGLTGFIISSFNDVYPFLRAVMGVAQSPVVLMVLLPFCIINELMYGRKINLF